MPNMKAMNRMITLAYRVYGQMGIILIMKFLASAEFSFFFKTTLTLYNPDHRSFTLYFEGLGL